MTKIKPPEGLPEDVAKAAGNYYIDRVLKSLGANPLRREVEHYGYIEIYVVIQRDGVDVESVERTLRENASFFAHGIVLETGELYTQGISGRLKYDTIFE